MFPFKGPREITSDWGPRTKPGTNEQQFHHGVDYRLAVGTQLFAPFEGRATRQDSPTVYGDMLLIESSDGRAVVYYTHLSKRFVVDGERVLEGELVALSGGAKGAPGAGNSTGPHLHLGVKVNRQWTDPKVFQWEQEVTPMTPDQEKRVLDFIHDEVYKATAQAALAIVRALGWGLHTAPLPESESWREAIKAFNLKEVKSVIK